MITVYTDEGFSGRRAEFNNSIPNLEDKGFNNIISSLRVNGAPWVAYSEQNYTGKIQVFEEGDYSKVEDKGSFSSLRLITDDLRNPELQLFQHINYAGQSTTLNDETNLHQVDFGDAASSHKVKSGVWVLYEHTGRRGRQLVGFPGENVRNYCEIGFNDMVSHVKPLLPR